MTSYSVQVAPGPLLAPFSVLQQAWEVAVTPLFPSTSWVCVCVVLGWAPPLPDPQVPLLRTEGRKSSCPCQAAAHGGQALPGWDPGTWRSQCLPATSGMLAGFGR